MARPGATHRAAAPSCTPATRDRTGQLHRDVHGLPAASREPGLLDESGLAPASRPRTVRGPPTPAGSPAILEPGPRARRHPGVPARLPFTLCAVTSMSSTTRGTIPLRQARRTGRQHTAAIQEDPVGGMTERPGGLTGPGCRGFQDCSAGGSSALSAGTWSSSSSMMTARARECYEHPDGIGPGGTRESRTSV
jgi:hypothetical protein